VERTDASNVLTTPPSTSSRPIAARTKMLLEGRILPTLLRLSAPNVLNLLALVGLITFDALFVGQLGSQALAGLTLVFPWMMLMQHTAASGMGGAVSSAIARALGAGRRDVADALATHALALTLALACIFSIAMLAGGPVLYRSMGGRGEVLAAALSYSNVVFAGSLSVCALNLLGNVVRGTGNMSFPATVIVGSVLAHILISPVLIFGWGPFPKLGVTGAALATFTGRSIGVGYQFYRLLRGSERIRILRQHVRINFAVLLRLVRVSLTGILQFAIAHTSWIGLVRIVSIFGSAALAGYTIAIRIVIFVILPSWGLSNAAATLVGQNLGAKQPERAASSVWRTGFYNMIFLGIIGLLFVVFAEPIVKLFTHDPQVVALAASCLRIISYGNIGYAYGMVMLQAFNGAGDTVTPTIVNFFGFWLLEIPLAYFLAIPMHLQARGAYISIVAAEAAIAAVSIVLFKQGRWKKQQI